MSVKSRIGTSLRNESRPRKNADAVAGQRDDEPRLRHLLHPGADAGDEGAEPEQAEVAERQGGRDAATGLVHKGKQGCDRSRCLGCQGPVPGVRCRCEGVRRVVKGAVNVALDFRFLFTI